MAIRTLNIIRSDAERRAIFLKKASAVTDQSHFDAIMDSFPEELRQEIYDEVKPLLRVKLEMKNKSASHLQSQTE